MTGSRGLRRWTEQALRRGELPVLNEALPRFERAVIRAAFTALSWSPAGGRAALLGWGRNTLTRKIKDLDLDI